MGEQLKLKQFSHLNSKINENLNKLLERWTIIDDKNLCSQDLLQDIPKLILDAQKLQEKVVKEGYSDDSLLNKLTILNTNLTETTIKVEWDTNRIYTDEVKKKEREVGQQKNKNNSF